MTNTFHSTTAEKGDLNQYWYSEKTCEVLCDAVKEIVSLKGGESARVAFLSTPSLFFSLGEEVRKLCTLFDFDNSLGSCSSQFEFYDYNNPTNIDKKLHHTFDVIVIDPPFISPSVWEGYSATAELLGVNENAHIICTTVEQNAGLMERLFNCKATRFQPSIPTLVYQYNTYANFPSAALSIINPELE